MAEEQELVDNLVQLVEQEILSKMILPNMTYDTPPHRTAVQQAEEILLSMQSALGDSLGDARVKARDAIRDWVAIVNEWISRPEEP